MPYQKYKDAKRHENLRPGDVCLLKYEGKIQGKYRYCRVVSVHPDEHGVVRTVEVSLRPRNRGEKSLPYRSKPVEVMTVGVQRLVLIVPNEEIRMDIQGRE